MITEIKLKYWKTIEKKIELTNAFHQENLIFHIIHPL